MEYRTVYSKEGMYAGWPANGGIWIWGNEILVGFQVGLHDESKRFHKVGSDKQETFARSLDGGESWQVETFSDAMIRSLAFGIDLGWRAICGDTFCLCGKYNSKTRTSDLYPSNTKGKTWGRPYRLPFPSMARTDYVVLEDRTVILLTIPKDVNGREGMVVSYEGKSLEELANMRVVAEAPERGFSIMPSTTLFDGVLVSAIRRQSHASRIVGIDIYAAVPGHAWELRATAFQYPAKHSSPASLITLTDGRLFMSTAIRNASDYQKSQVVGMTSDDGGYTWNEKIVLDSHPGSEDFGYTRSVQRKDGKVVTVYYWHPNDSPYRIIKACVHEVN